MVPIFAITGPPGSGKTTLINYIKQHIADSCIVCMDDYQQMTSWSSLEISDWILSGADYNDLPMPGLVSALRKCKYHPYGRSNELNYRLILFESHIGRSQTSLIDLVDFVIWLDTDYDLALARALLSTLQSIPEELDLSYYLEFYCSYTYSLVRTQNQRIRPHADFIYNGNNDLLIAWILSLISTDKDG